ncbi:hypothetical protein II5_00475 [Bacillus cereus MSX-A1]|uniref:hypothetical protein n=1 Tax=Bacillus cereus TaxID=1396 RepID=UPI000279738A|nr:hypothetical protein [Bacillus cereus]EJR09222.1 hypothetical protein II5_00475 [Bacillus cereus MSX-A1]MDR4293249.1 hypothetical protein [Bacillus cereus]
MTSEIIQDPSCCYPKRELIKINRQFKLAAECNAEEKTFFITHPPFFTTNISTFLTVSNLSSSCNLVINILSGCETVTLTISPGSTGNFYVGVINEMSYSCESLTADCTESICRGLVQAAFQYVKTY